MPVLGCDASIIGWHARLARSCPMALRQFSMWQVSAVPDDVNIDCHDPKTLAGTRHPNRLRPWHKLLIPKGKR